MLVNFNSTSLVSQSELFCALLKLSGMYTPVSFPNQSGAIDRALYKMREELPKALKCLTFTNTPLHGISCQDLPDILTVANKNDMLNDMGANRQTSIITISNELAEQIVKQHGLSLQQARDLSRKFRYEINSEENESITV